MSPPSAWPAKKQPKAMNLNPHSQIPTLAGARTLLVVSDFDGTLAGFNKDPYNVPVSQRGTDALTQLAACPDTIAAVLSGRDLKGLARVCPEMPGVLRVGSHGAENPLGGVSLNAEQEDELARIEAELEKILEGQAGTFVEYKPFQRCAHVMELAMDNQAAADQLIEQVLKIPHDKGTHITHGKNIVEFSVVDVTKGTWLRDATKHFEADAVVFLGDDRTDENGFAVMRSTDVAIKVGEGATRAAYRLPDIPAVGEFLSELAIARQSHTG